MDFRREKFFSEKLQNLLWGYPALLDGYFVYFHSLRIITLESIVAGNVLIHDDADGAGSTDQGLVGYYGDLVVGLRLPSREASLYKHKDVIPVSEPESSTCSWFFSILSNALQGCEKEWP